MQVSFNIDVCNAAHVAALHHFMNVLGEHTVTMAVPTSVPAAEPKKTRATKATPEPTPAPEQVQEPETTSELIDEAVVSVTMLRTAVSDLVKSNSELRDVIIAKLAELNAQSVSTLAVKHFDTFYNFLKTLA